jgi:hypothetical protein
VPLPILTRVVGGVARISGLWIPNFALKRGFENESDMNLEHFFVGGVAVLLGGLALLAAIHNRDWYYQLPKTRWIENRWGRRGARIFYAILGVALLALGIFVLLGLHQ